MKSLPLGIQTFRDLILRNYVYIDKTRYIYNLFVNGGKYYFISRPRRFGKSLLISTLREIFSANQELFKGLWIYEKIQWEKHPIIHLDFSKTSYGSPDILVKSLDAKILKIAADFEVTVDSSLPYKDKFGELIEKLSQKGKVVIRSG
jgi:hypothetical protein